MTRAQYEQLYGVAPVASSSNLDNTPAPVRMTQAEYNALYRPKETTTVEKAGKAVSNVAEGGAAFPADKNAGVLSNFGRYVGNIPGSAYNLARAVVSPVNPFDLNNPMNIGANLSESASDLKEIASNPQPLKSIGEGILSTLSGGYSIWNNAGKDIYDNLEKNALQSKTLAGGVAASAADLGIKLSEAVINDPTLVPALLWAPKDIKVISSPDIITKVARPVIDTTKKVAQTAYRASKLDTVAETLKARQATAIEKELFDIENNYVTTRKANAYLSDAGAASRARIAQTDVLAGAVDTDGILRTTQPNGAVAKYKALTVGGVEDVVRNNLIREAATANVEEFAKKLKTIIATQSKLEGADLVKALKGVQREVEGLKLRADEFGNAPLYRFHDAKIATTSHINYLTPPETATYRKAVARAYKELVEEKSTFNVKAVNNELKKYYQDINLLERLDGKRVKGAKLGKYFASVSGNIIGGAAGNAVGGPLGTAIGTILGGEAAQLIKGRSMSSTFGKERGVFPAENKILAEAKASAKLPPTKDLRIPDKAVGAPKGVTKTKEMTRLESQIKKNVEAQKAAIKAGDFTLVEALKEVYQILVDKLKEAIKIAKVAMKDQRGFIRLDGGQSKSLGSRNTTYSPTNSTSNKPISKNLAKIEETSKAQVFDGFPDLTTKVLNNLKGKSTVSKQFIQDLTNKPELRQPERDLIREVLSEFDAPKVSGVSDELIAEARKYKSAEEFANNAGAIRDNFDWSYLDEMKARKAAGESYSHSDFNYLSKIESAKRGKESRTFYRAGSIGKDGDIWLTPQEAGATQYGSAGGTKVGEYKVATKNPLILQDVESIEKILGKKLAGESNFTNSPAQKQAVIDYAKKNGYDSVLMPDSFPDGAAGMESLVVWDRNLIKTKSQLTDIYNQAHQTTDKIPVQEFADKVKARLLPLDSVSTNKSGNADFVTRYENITLPDDLRGNVANYTEKIYTSPIDTSAGDVHFGHSFVDSEARRGYFAHTRIEDMAPSPYESANPITGKRSGSVRRVIEIQSDLFQKGRLEDEIDKLVPQSFGPATESSLKNDIKSLEKGISDNLSGGTRNILQNKIEEKKALLSALEDKRAELSPLQPYRNTWWERIIREEVRTAAQDGKTKLQFPTGETAMKIEGLGAVNQKWGNYTQKLPLTPENLEKGLRVGDEVGRIPTINDFTPDVMDKWIITEVLGDGKFKAVPKSGLQNAVGDYTDTMFNNTTDMLYYGEHHAKDYLDDYAETFDISGKVDTSNPIYKFYEKDVQKYLKNKYNAQVVTDEQGVQWVQMDVPKDANKIPVEAFGVLPFAVAGTALSTQ